MVCEVRTQGTGILQEVQNGNGVRRSKSGGENPGKTGCEEAETADPRAQRGTLECFKQRDNCDECDGDFGDSKPVDHASCCRIALGKCHASAGIGNEVPSDGQSKDSQSQ